MLSLVPGYMVVSWTLRLPAVGVRVTWGVEGQPMGVGCNWGMKDKYTRRNGPHTSSPRRGLTVVLTHSVPNMLNRAILSEYSVPACSPMM